MSNDTSLKLISACIVCSLVATCWVLFPHPIIPIVFALIPFAVWFSLRFSFVIILAFVVFSFFRIHEVIVLLDPLHIPQLLALGGLFVIFVRAIITRDLDVYWEREFTLLTVFFGLVTIGVFFAENRAIAINSWTGVYVKIYIMTLVTAWLMRKEKDFSLAIRFFVYAGLLVACVALYNKSNGIGLVEGTRVTIGREISSILGDPNDLALVLLFPTAFALSTTLEKNLTIFQRCFGGVVLVILISAIIATQSRGGLLGVLSVVGISAYHRVKSKVLLFSLGSIALIILFAAAGISDRSSGGAAEEGIDESAMGRIYAWGAAWGMALDNPILGVGIKNFYFNYFYYSAHWDGLNHAVHSTWFGVLAETGFVGLIVFVWMLVLVFMTSWRALMLSKRIVLPSSISVAANAVPAGITGFIVSGTFLTQGFTWPIYLQLAIAVAVSRFIKEYQKNYQEKVCQ